MKNWIGKPFVEWCKADPNDERKINYNVRGVWEGKEQIASFTSAETMESMWLFRLQNSRIAKIQLVSDEWYVELVY